MAIAIPSQYIVSQSTTITEDYGTKYDYSEDGAIYSRDLFAKTMYDINASWELLTPDEAKALRAFFINYRNSEILITIDDETYNGRIVGFPQVSWVGGLTQNVSSKFRAFKV